MRKDVIYNEECLAGMARRLPKASVDMILCDLPYGTTANAWDTVIDLEKLWAEYKRVIRPGGAIVLTAQAPFDKVLGASNLQWFRHEWIWQKNRATGHLHAKHAPLKSHETVLVFCEKGAPYNPQGLTRLIRPERRKAKTSISANYGGGPRGEYLQTSTNYPKSVLSFPCVNKTVHPTQKPVELFEYLIRTYSRPGQTVLDNCIGVGTTALACLNSGRHYVGFELNAEYVGSATNRIRRAQPVAEGLALAA